MPGPIHPPLHIFPLVEGNSQAIFWFRSIPSSGKNAREHPNSKINMPGHSPKVFVNNLKSDNQIIKIFYWCFTADIWEFRKFNHQINSLIIEHFNAEGIEFAIPAQRIEIKSQTDQHTSD